MEGAPQDAAVRIIEVTAQKYHFVPAVIRVKRGTVVRLVFQSLDTEHGVKIPRYGIDVDIPKNGHGTVAVEFYTRDLGTYDFHCSNFCGLGHWGMDGKIFVEE